MRVSGHGVAHHEDGATLLVVPMVKVGFVPRLEFLDSRKGGMLFFHNTSLETGSLMALESPSHKLVEFRNVRKAPTRAMHRHKTAAVADIGLQVLPLFSRKSRMVCVNQQSIKLTKVSDVIQSRSDAGHVIEIDGIPTERLRQHRVILVRVMVFALVTEEKDSNRVGEGSVE